MQIKSGGTYDPLNLCRMGFVPKIRVEFQGPIFRKLFGAQGVVYSKGDEDYLFASNGVSLMALRRYDSPLTAKISSQPIIRVPEQPRVRVPEEQLRIKTDFCTEG